MVIRPHLTCFLGLFLLYVRDIATVRERVLNFEFIIRLRYFEALLFVKFRPRVSRCLILCCHKSFFGRFPLVVDSRPSKVYALKK